MNKASPPPMYSITEVAAGLPAGLDLDGTGVPRRPLCLIDLDGTATATEIAAAACHIRRSLLVSVGVASSAINDAYLPLAEAATMTLVAAAPTSASRRRPTRLAVVPVADLDDAVAAVASRVAQSPQAAVVLGQVLRQSELLDVWSGLAAEAAAYSSLLAGGDFARWLTAQGGPKPIPGSGDPVRLQRDGDLLTVTLDRPARRNAMDGGLREALVEALSVAVADPQLQVELVGAGADFCSGGDLDEFGSATDVVAAYLVRLERHPGWLLHLLRDRTTVRVQGAGIGAGIELAAFAGRIIAAPTAFFALPETAMGLIPGAGGTVSITGRIGRWRTAWLALTGVRLDAATAAEWGLIDEIVEP